MEDRRRHGRHATDLQLELFELPNHQRLGRLADLSLDGFMLFSETPPAVDTLIECVLIPDHVSEHGDDILDIRLRADCLWARPSADGKHCWAGFHIVDIAPDQLARLQQLLSQL
jgi:hypothetical protein